MEKEFLLIFLGSQNQKRNFSEKIAS